LLFWEIGAPQTADRSRQRPLSIVIPISHPRSNTCRLRRQVLVGGKLGQQAPQTLESWHGLVRAVESGQPGCAILAGGWFPPATS